MEKQFVTYKIALKLKELGFDEECLACFHTFLTTDNKLPLFRNFIINKNSAIKNHVSAPLWQQAIDWFREKYNIVLTPDIRIIDKCTFFHIKQYDEIDFWVNAQENPLPYYEAREQAILKAIELCKNNS